MDEDDPPLPQRLFSTVLKPVRLAVSRPAQRVYLRTFLFLLTASFLYGIASISYLIFYNTYVPSLGFSSPVHLIFHDGRTPPHGTVLFPISSTLGTTPLVADQPYDVFVTLTLPRSSQNLAEGNFMVDLEILGTIPTASGGGLGALVPQPVNDVLARSQRPAIISYRSPFVRYARTFFWLPALVLGWTHEKETIRTSMFEGVSLRRTPRAATLSLRTWELNPAIIDGTVIQNQINVYDAKLEVLTRLWGLRWLMYNFRITSFIVLTSMFWGVEVFAMIIGWALISARFRVARGDDSGASTPRRLSEGGKRKRLLGLTNDISSKARATPKSPNETGLSGQRTSIESTIKEEDEEDLTSDEETVAKQEIDETMESTKIEPLASSGISDATSRGSTSGSQATEDGSRRRRPEWTLSTDDEIEGE